ncbi:Kae1-associated kinase Bud32 [Clavispora lusitaniae]|uniref:EKC/KEOPS complex subunit BUD32 n=2 Tax=Clavispora lusitaniae TaxID=36911 RepID=C4Y0Q7_CLAL4|nr:uncharacterized protein CLUG_01789 [Clavispora lusitaniae ATCC 42720]EEQ37666.1 hypothetical protein CLUG_01789 [Clavispora lusitaniae ATCC 42720]KAF5211990.1 serine/threonine-protein kinase bud32 [Clavispora lusitaniae]KAF7583384.1 Kae1-associated kinase Bud32 [Clavispora lusitaniae]OVF06256.1 putative EKC/KEOPS complex subunit [Clavispora lusitaniae]
MTDAILGQVRLAIPEIPFSVVSQGAEALVLSTPVHPYSESRGKNYIVKYRPPKPYRHPKIDASITKSRTVGEAKFMVRLNRVGIPAPTLISLDATNGVIWMESIGETLSSGEVSSLKNYLWHLEKSGQDCLGSEVEHLCKETGRVIGRLHMNDMIHGDLTTSNIILQQKEAMLIDFGLSSYSNLAEDKAVDLYVMERAVSSTHSDYAEKYTDWLLSGYADAHKGNKKLRETLRKLEDVRLRGRKRSMLG